MLHTMHHSELIRCYSLDRAGITILLETRYISNTAPEMDVISTLTYLGTGKMQVMISVCNGTRCSFLIKYVKYDSMANKKRKNIYTYNVCVCVCEREIATESPPPPHYDTSLSSPRSQIAPESLLIEDSQLEMFKLN